MRDPSRVVTRLLVVGGAFFPVLAFLFWITTPLGLLGAAYLALLLELAPVLALAQLPVVDSQEELPRIPVYLTSGATVLILGWMALAVGDEFPGEALMGLGPKPLISVLLWTVGLLAVLLLLLGVFHLLGRALDLRESPIVAQLMPRTLQEKGAFGLLSLAAGVGEELAYRGYAVPVLGILLGSSWGGVLLSSAVFGFLHAYQGWVGIFRTALMGFLLAVGFQLSGSLWPAILAHAALDLLVGLVLADRLLKE